MKPTKVPAQFIAPSAEVQDPEELGLLTKLAGDLIKLDDRIEKGEQLLAELKEQRQRLAEVSIPDKMTSLGLESITVLGGYVLEISPFYSGSIRRINDDKTMPYDDRAFDWLETNGHGGVIKTEINIPLPRGQIEFARSLANDIRGKFGCKTELERSVHAQTLKGLVREIMESGNTLPEDLFKIHTGRQAKIKAPKRLKA